MKETFSVALLSVLALLLSRQQVHAADAKLFSQLKSMRASSPSGLIKLNIDKFQDLVEASSRTYSLLVLFSADSHFCPQCAAITHRLGRVADEYYSLPPSKAASKPLFFAVVKITPQDREFLMQYGLTHVPVLYHFGAGKSREYPRQLSRESADNFPIQELGYAPNAIKSFINSRSGSQLRIVRGNYQIPFVQTVKDLMPFILLTAAVLAAGIVATGAYKSPMLWFGIVVLIYIFSVGGGHYSWINNTPLAAVNMNGEMEYVSGGSRSQYVAEGFFVSATCVSISFLVILIQELPSIIPNKHAQTVTGLTLVTMIAMAIKILVALYQVKMPQYLHYNALS